ncbi:MAG: RDD family protein, partial [Vicinamibacterales bacterium]
GDRCRPSGFDMSLGSPVPEAQPLQPETTAGLPPALPDLSTRRVLTPNSPAVPSEWLTMQDAAEASIDAELPLFDRPIPGVDDTPLVVAPATPRSPLSVRRSALDPPRERSVDALSDWDRQVEHHVDRLRTESKPAPQSPLPPPPPAPRVQPVRRTEESGDRPAAIGVRLGAAFVDAVILIAIDFAVVYFTLQLTQLDFTRVGSLPFLPLLAFIALLNGGYFIGFTVASGQTIGKMATGIQVVSESARKVSLGAAILRAAGLLVTVLSVGVGYLPALFGRERRALHDRLAGTRVISRLS